MKHHQKRILIQARRIGIIILMCLLIQQLGLHNSQGDEQKLSSTTFMSLIDNRELLHGDRAEVSAAPGLGRLQQQSLSPPTIVTSHIPAQSVISAPPLARPVELLLLPAAHHEQQTIDDNDDNVSASKLTMKTSTKGDHDEIVSKLNHRVQRDQETTDPKATAPATTGLPHLVLVTNEIHADQIYIAEPVVPADLKSNIKKAKASKSILEWLKDKHRLKHAIGQTVLNEIETNKSGGNRFAADDGRRDILTSSNIVVEKVPTPAPESIGADKLSMILMEDRLLADKTKSGSKSSARIEDKRMAPIITSVLSTATATTSPPPSLVALADKRRIMDPCATSDKATCFSKFLFGGSYPNKSSRNPVNVVASKTDLENLISNTKRSEQQTVELNSSKNQLFMHFG